MLITIINIAQYYTKYMWRFQYPSPGWPEYFTGCNTPFTIALRRTHVPLFGRFRVISPTYRTYDPLFAVKQHESAPFSSNNVSSVRNQLHYRLFSTNRGSCVR